MKIGLRLVLLFCLFGTAGCGLFNQKIPAGRVPDPAPTDHFIRIKGVDYHYNEYPGDGENIVLQHGFAASTYTWTDVAEILNKHGYHVWALDLKGFGWSDKPVMPRMT